MNDADQKRNIRAELAEAKPFAREGKTFTVHDRRNEVHAIWLGIRLVQEQVEMKSWEDARTTCEALRVSADILRQMELQPTAAREIQAI